MSEKGKYIVFLLHVIMKIVLTLQTHGNVCQVVPRAPEPLFENCWPRLTSSKPMIPLLVFWPPCNAFSSPKPWHRFQNASHIISLPTSNPPSDQTEIQNPSKGLHNSALGNLSDVTCTPSSRCLSYTSTGSKEPSSPHLDLHPRCSLLP